MMCHPKVESSSLSEDKNGGRVAYVVGGFFFGVVGDGFESLSHPIYPLSAFFFLRFCLKSVFCFIDVFILRFWEPFIFMHLVRWGIWRIVRFSIRIVARCGCVCSLASDSLSAVLLA
jgi:hypothetical protein